LHDAGNGVRATDGVNAYASGVSIGASWNASLAYVRGQHMGREFRKKGVHVALGPVVGPIGRIATGGKHCLHTGVLPYLWLMLIHLPGRSWEGFGADPYMDGVLGAQSIRGLQESVIASVKHFVANVSSQCPDPRSKFTHLHFHLLGARNEPKPHCGKRNTQQLFQCR
jgi:beta-glucosidase